MTMPMTALTRSNQNRLAPKGMQHSSECCIEITPIPSHGASRGFFIELSGFGCAANKQLASGLEVDNDNAVALSFDLFGLLKGLPLLVH